jgi:uncharacterized YigZ family protein
MEIDNYLTLGAATESKVKIKGSVFIIHSYFVQNLDEAHLYLEGLKKKYFDATHICYALNLINNTVRYSDAGEPQGTAGIRILNAIQHFQLSDILVAVVRYFGGTKLGVGPLGKAYYECALSNLTEAPKIEKKKFIRLKIKINFDFIGNIYNILSSFESKITNTSYSEKGDTIKIEALVFIKKYSFLVEEIKNNSNGKASVERIEELYL